MSLNILDGAHWYGAHRADRRAFALYRQHYSAAKNAPWRRPGNTNFVSPCESHLVLLTVAGDALFTWVRQEQRDDGQVGVNCAVFHRTRSCAVVASDLIREADAIAWERWPGEPRHFTYVDPTKVARKRQPGRVFLKADWRYVRDERGELYRSTRGLLLLERLP